MLDPYKYKPGYYWLSFAEETGFLGVVIVQAESYDQALQKAWELEINPGGNVLGGLMVEVPSEKWHDRLLNRKMLKEMELEYPRFNGRN